MRHTAPSRTHKATAPYWHPLVLTTRWFRGIKTCTMRKRQATFLLWIVLVVSARTAHAEAEDSDNGGDGCAGGFCPNENKKYVGDCGFWLGPSPIKSKEEHGFGVGAFTGKLIPEGTTLESMFYGGGDTLGEINLPLFANQALVEQHTPLFDNLWDEANIPQVAVNYPEETTVHYFPSLAAFAPCTDSNYNMIMVGKGNRAGDGRQAAETDTAGVHRSTHATAGSFSYYSKVQYRAVRDIAPGEELTVECDDNAFDGGNYFLSRFDGSSKAVTCIDRYARVGVSPGLGHGLFAKRPIPSGASIISTPLVPLARSDMDIVDERIPDKQLMFNYAYGHPDSDLLLLPAGPMVNYINHNGNKPNAVIRWHDPTLSKEELASLERREEYHHFNEIKYWSAERVVNTHGIGLVMDIVATRPISQGEEIFIDYGSDWQAAWDKHRATWRYGDSQYVDADSFRRTGAGGHYVRTIVEQAINPYPRNLDTYCWYTDEDGTEDDEDTTEIADDLFFVHFDNGNEKDCLRPCRIVERVSQDGEEALYTVELDDYDNDEVSSKCLIDRDTFLGNVPEHAILVLDKPRTSDMLRKGAFRHEIGVPSGFFPAAWMRKKARLGGSGRSQSVNDLGDEFRRKSDIATKKGNETKTKMNKS